MHKFPERTAIQNIYSTAFRIASKYHRLFIWIREWSLFMAGGRWNSENCSHSKTCPPRYSQTTFWTAHWRCALNFCPPPHPTACTQILCAPPFPPAPCRKLWPFPKGLKSKNAFSQISARIYVFNITVGQVQKKWGVFSVMLFIMISAFKSMYAILLPWT